MGNKFVGNPQVLRAKGGIILNQADQFQQNTNKVYSTVEELVNSDYLAPEARAIAQEIEKYHADLNNMAKIMADYGTYCSDAGVTIINNQDSITSSVKL